MEPTRIIRNKHCSASTPLLVVVFQDLLTTLIIFVKEVWVERVTITPLSTPILIVIIVLLLKIAQEMLISGACMVPNWGSALPNRSVRMKMDILYQRSMELRTTSALKAAGTTWEPATLGTTE